MENYYHIDINTLDILNGPFKIFSTYSKKITNCGNPDKLNLLEYGIVTEIKQELPDDTFTYGIPKAFQDRVEIPVIKKSPEEIRNILASYTKSVGDSKIYAIIPKDQINNAINYGSRLTNKLVKFALGLASDLSPEEAQEEAVLAALSDMAIAIRKAQNIIIDDIEDDTDEDILTRTFEQIDNDPRWP